MSWKEIVEAYYLAKESHEGQKRINGEPFMLHPIAAAKIAKEHGGDDGALCACLLHDIVEDCGVSLTTIEESFGRDIAFLVDGVTKLSTQEETFEKTRQFAEIDKRVALVKLCDRVHNTYDLGSGNGRTRKIREKYSVSNPWYIELGRENNYLRLANLLEDLTKQNCLGAK